MSFNPTDYIPHGLVVAMGGIVSYVFREHTKQDDARFNAIQTDLRSLVDGQTIMAKNIADNHAEVLKMFISQNQHTATMELIKAQEND